MPIFKYRARAADGQLLVGELEGLRAADIAGQLERRGIVPTSIIEKSRDPEGFSLRLTQPVSAELLIMFSRQMHALLEAGVPITRSMRGLAEANRSDVFRAVLQDVARLLESGVELSRALQSHSDIFGALYVSMIRVGENTGQLEDAFIRLAEHLERERDAKRRFKQATRYPVFLMFAILGALTLISVWVIPSFESLFAKFDSELPLATRLLIGLSDMTKAYGVAVLLLTMIVGGLLFSWLKTEQGELVWHRNMLALPIIGSLLHNIALSRFAHSFAMVIRAGMPVTEGLSIASSATGNRWISQRVQRMRQAIERGESLYPAAMISGVFTNLVLQMIAVGEESGRLDSLLEDVAQFYDEEVDYSLKTLTDLIEPILITAMGMMVLVLALGVALPIWDLGNAAMGAR